MASSTYLKIPALFRALIYLAGNFFIIFLLQLITNGILPPGGVGLNILIPVAVLLFTKWILHLEGRKLADIGCLPTKKRDAGDYAIGLLIGIVMMVCTALLIKLLTGFRWELNPHFRSWSLLSIFVTIAGSVYAQELAFRGYPFQLLLDKYGIWPAQIIIAFLFGCMHFMEGSMSLPYMLLLLLSTGAGSVLYGIAYIRTRRLALPIALHLGWNFCQYLLPRHPLQNGPGIWVIDPNSFNLSELGFLTWMIPYLAITILSCVALFYLWPRKNCPLTA